MSNFVPVPDPGAPTAPTVPVDARPPSFKPLVPAAAAAPAAAAPVAPKPAPKKAPRKPKPTDRAEQQKAIAAACQQAGIPVPMGRFSPERAAVRAARMAQLNPATMTQAEADARGITEPAALARVGL